ncbi:MAG: sterol 3-beta-glucosyltransferase [Oscillospiraceae bacterium]|jgi:sterol 3beta-glucosyltransferase|nr:sterol 3-beta-glucosyltransferase [Oscillospiraceae bacterium]
MRVCFLTLGSRGDVQPYVALAKCLIKHGHQATICTGESFQGFIESNGIRYKKTTLDLMALANTAKGKAVLESPLKHAGLAMQLYRDVIRPAYRQTMDDFYDGAKDSDILVYHPKAFGAVDIAVSLEIPCVSMPPIPITYPITEFPNIAVSSTANFGKRINRMTYMVNRKAESAQIKEINDFRKKTLNLPNRKAGIYAFTRSGEEIPTVYPVSPLLFPEVDSWNGHVVLPGFFFLHSENGLDSDLEAFLCGEEKPIAVTFSSMPLKNPDAFIRKLEAALIATNNRAVILSGNSGILKSKSDRIYVTKQAPHDLLFATCKGAIHHGGVGTMAAALCAGVPQLVIPFSVDQPFWANRLNKLGCSIKTLREKTLTVADLTNAFIEMDNSDIRHTAKRVGEKINLENGVENAVGYLECLIENEK